MIKCNKCGNFDINQFENICYCVPNHRIKIKECKICRKYNDYYKEFEKIYGKLNISQLIIKENIKELKIKGYVNIK